MRVKGKRLMRKEIGIIGTGLIASGMATAFIANGHLVRMLATGDSSRRKGENAVRKNLSELETEGIIAPYHTEQFLKNLKTTTNYGDLKHTELIVEAVAEKLDVKYSVYRKLEENCREDTVIASTTSAISADKLAEGLTRKNRLIVAHPWNPSHLVPCVEIVRSRYTDEFSFQKVMEIMKSIGKETVVLKKNIEGFIGNRIMHAMYREALYLVEKGVASPEDIDRMILNSFGPRFGSVGVLEYYESCGLDLQKEVQTYLFPTLCDAKGPQRPMLDCVERGELGPRTGKGIFEWSPEYQEEFRYRKSKPFFHCFKWKELEEEL